MGRPEGGTGEEREREGEGEGKGIVNVVVEERKEDLLRSKRDFYVAKGEDKVKRDITRRELTPERRTTVLTSYFWCRSREIVVSYTQGDYGIRLQLSTEMACYIQQLRRVCHASNGWICWSQAVRSSCTVSLCSRASWATGMEDLTSCNGHSHAPAGQALYSLFVHAAIEQCISQTPFT